MDSKNHRNVYILAFTLVVVTLGFGVVIPIIPFYMESMGAGGTELGLLVASYAVMRLIFGPIWGILSDRVGRKPVLMIGILGYGLTMVLFGLATELWMLFVIRSLSGILSSATSPTTMAYISDSTTEEERGRGMGVLGAAIGLGTIVGPGFGGWLGGENLVIPFFIAGGMSFLALVLTAVLLPESLPAAVRQQAGERAKPRPGMVVWRNLLGSIGVLLWMAFLASFILTTFYGIFGLYALEKFGYGTQEVGVVMMVVGLVSAVAQGLLTGPLTGRWGEAAVIKGSLLVTAAGFIAITLSGSYGALLASVGLFTLASALLTPAVTAMSSKRSLEEQGITMGVVNSFISLGRIAGPLIAGVAFDYFIELPYWIGAALVLAGFFTSLFTLHREVPHTTVRTGLADSSSAGSESHSTAP